MKKIDVVVIGSSNTDMVIRLDRLPRPGETVIGGEFNMAAGGKGANQAVGASRAGGHVTMVACLGRDMFGNQAIDGFKKESGVALICVDKKTGENSIAVASGANGHLSVKDVENARKAIARADVVIMQLEIPLAVVEAAATLASKAGVRIILNPAPAQHLTDALLKQVSIFTPNEIEAEFYTGIKVKTLADAARACDELISRGIETVIITLGARGSFVATKNEKKLVPSFKVTPVDTTGAGDIYNGALAVALGEGQSIFEAALFANAAGALAATRLGAQPSAPKRDEIDALLTTADIVEQAEPIKKQLSACNP